MRQFILGLAALVLVGGSVALAGEGGRSAMIEITNTTNGKLVYELTWGGEAKLFAVEAGATRWHSFKIELSDESLPLPIVRTDVDITDGQRIETYQLLPKFVDDPNEETGAEYTFGFNADETELEIASK